MADAENRTKRAVLREMTEFYPYYPCFPNSTRAYVCCERSGEIHPRLSVGKSEKTRERVSGAGLRRRSMHLLRLMDGLRIGGPAGHVSLGAEFVAIARHVLGWFSENISTLPSDIDVA